MKLLTDYAKQITDPIFDVCCDTNLSPGQSLTVLKMVEEVLNREIAGLEDTVDRINERAQLQTAISNLRSGQSKEI